MKESEAKKKFCPYVAVSDAILSHSLTQTYARGKQTKGDDDIFKETSALFDQKCRGSKCMMWCQQYDDIESPGYCGLTNS